MQDWLELEPARRMLDTGTGRSVRVAVLDSGVDVSHPILAGLTLADDVVVTVEGGRLVCKANPEGDCFGHGTAVTGVLRQAAPEAEVGSFRIFGGNPRFESAVVCEAARQALARGYDVLNCSFACRGPVEQFKDWVDQAYLSGVHVVAACDNRDYSDPVWPGFFPTVLTVNKIKTDQSRFFWRRGSLVEFAARGVDVEVAWLAHASRKFTGSSYAAPLVTGWLARLLSQSPKMSPLHVKALMQRLASPWPETELDSASEPISDARTRGKVLRRSLDRRDANEIGRVLRSLTSSEGLSVPRELL